MMIATLALLTFAPAQAGEAPAMPAPPTVEVVLTAPAPVAGFAMPGMVSRSTGPLRGWSLSDRVAYADKDRRTMRTFRIGAVLGIGGLALTTIGVVLVNPYVALLGGVCVTAGSPIMLAASWHSNSVLALMTDENKNHVPALIGWVFLGGSLVAANLATLDLQAGGDGLTLSSISTGLLAGSYAMAVVQNGVNRRLRRKGGLLAADEGRLHVQLAPFVASTRRGSLDVHGLAVRGAW